MPSKLSRDFHLDSYPDRSLYTHQCGNHWQQVSSRYFHFRFLLPFPVCFPLAWIGDFACRPKIVETELLNHSLWASCTRPVASKMVAWGIYIVHWRNWTWKWGEWTQGWELAREGGPGESCQVKLEPAVHSVDQLCRLSAVLWRCTAQWPQ